MTTLDSLCATTIQNETKRALVLSGGGMRLSYQAGAMLALEEAQLTFHHFDATSGGSMNMSMLFSGLTPTTMCNRWASLKMRDSVSILPLNNYLHANNLEGLGDADGIRNNVFPHLGINSEKIRAVNNVIGTYNVLDYDDKQVKVIPHSEIDLDMMIAGISLPGVFPPVRKNNKTYLDTAFIQDANLMEAVRRGAEEIWLIWGLGNTANYQGGPLNIYIQMLETSANGALNNEISQIQELNQRIQNGDSPYGQSKPIQLNIIQPKRPLPLDPDLYLGKISNATLVDMGYADAKAYLNTRPAQGLSPGINMTRMIESEPGLRFCEKQNGELTFNHHTDNQQNHATSLDITIHINSFEKFMTTPSTKERVTGRVSIAGLVENKMIDDGCFFITVPEENPEMKVLNYQVIFSKHFSKQEEDTGNQEYILHGKKKLFDDPGFDFIDDLRTVYTSLYKSNDSSTPIATGALKLSLKALAGQATSITTTHTDSIVESAKMVAKFSALCFMEGNETQQPA